MPHVLEGSVRLFLTQMREPAESDAERDCRIIRQHQYSSVLPLRKDVIARYAAFFQRESWLKRLNHCQNDDAGQKERR
jgi:hypothetical protein